VLLPPIAVTARASVRLQGPLYAFKQYFLLHEVVFKDISDSSRMPPPANLDTRIVFLAWSLLSC
jgi:hypothetical protein